MAKIFLPSDYLNNCNVVYDGYIRSYTDDSHTHYYDIYPRMNYAIKEGFDTSSELILCDSYNIYTDDFYYRFDLADSLIIFMIMGFVMYGAGSILLTRLFRRFKL